MVPHLLNSTERTIKPEAWEMKVGLGIGRLSKVILKGESSVLYRRLLHSWIRVKGTWMTSNTVRNEANMIHSEGDDSLDEKLLKDMPIENVLEKMWMSFERRNNFQYDCLVWETELVVLYLFRFPFLSDYKSLYVIPLELDIPTRRSKILIFNFYFAWQLHFAFSISNITLFPIIITSGINDFKTKSQMFLGLQPSTASQTICSESVWSGCTSVFECPQNLKSCNFKKASYM